MGHTVVMGRRTWDPAAAAPGRCRGGAMSSSAATPTTAPTAPEVVGDIGAALSDPGHG